MRNTYEAPQGRQSDHNAAVLGSVGGICKLSGLVLEVSEILKGQKGSYERLQVSKVARCLFFRSLGPIGAQHHTRLWGA